ncbi:MAG: hypothetical protein MK212_22235, partial [Saprospiraceae bacterium]|nr:hypothetical protein [Saprospiraceae bacterium]
MHQKIRDLLFSTDKQNQKLAWELDKSINNGALRKELSKEYTPLMNLLGLDLETLMSKTEITLSHKEITTLPKIPPLVKKLYCNNNYLTSLPPLANITELYCSEN